ncbi:MAG: GNAT family N-acetyltransferase [Chloracidobacterium sp.]|nr:GNAT family N-acetyltransferase [Chloracidobacterium sp.]
MRLSVVTILNSRSEDLETILDLYDAAIEFQKTVFDKHWLGFDEDRVRSEIADGRLWKIVEDGDIACIFSVTYQDPIIWGENSRENAMYLHRIVTNPKFRGRGYVKLITAWAKAHARENGLRFVRMDTWGDNQKLIEYYRACGFRYVGDVTPDGSDSMPPHYRGIKLGLLEIDLNPQK